MTIRLVLVSITSVCEFVPLVAVGIPFSRKTFPVMVIGGNLAHSSLENHFNSTVLP